MNKKYLVKYKKRWLLVYVVENTLYTYEKIHINEARLIAINIERKCLHSFDIICDYFGGTSKVNDYNPYSNSWLLAS